MWALDGTEFLLSQGETSPLLAGCDAVTAPETCVRIPWEGCLTSWPGSEWGSVQGMELGRADGWEWGTRGSLSRELLLHSQTWASQRGSPKCHWSFLLPDLRLPEILSQQMNPSADACEESMCDKHTTGLRVCVCRAAWYDLEVYHLKESPSWHIWLGELWQVTSFFWAALPHLSNGDNEIPTCRMAVSIYSNLHIMGFLAQCLGFGNVLTYS